MISASTLSCYSTLSSCILTTNCLITFLTLHSRYPVLQPINTYYSLIGAVYVFRVCALFCPRIASPLLYRYYPHVLSISRNCLAPPHFPESPHRTFIPQCIYSPHSAFTPCEIFNSVSFLLLSVYFVSLCQNLVLCICLSTWSSLVSSSCSCSLPSVSWSSSFSCKSRLVLFWVGFPFIYYLYPSSISL